MEQAAGDMTRCGYVVVVVVVVASAVAVALLLHATVLHLHQQR
jgi:hypothetical protein